MFKISYCEIEFSMMGKIAALQHGISSPCEILLPACAMRRCAPLSQSAGAQCWLRAAARPGPAVSKMNKHTEVRVACKACRSLGNGVAGEAPIRPPGRGVTRAAAWPAPRAQRVRQLALPAEGAQHELRSQPAPAFLAVRL